jgi:hypothetical protein
LSRERRIRFFVIHNTNTPRNLLLQFLFLIQKSSGSEEKLEGARSLVF